MKSHGIDIIRKMIASGKLPMLSEDAEVSHLAGDASSRDYYRVNPGPEKNPVIICYAQPTQKNADVHQRFLRAKKYFDSENIRTPEVYHFDLESGLLVLEDLGNQTFLQLLANLSTRDKQKRYYLRLVEILKRIHQFEGTNSDLKGELESFNFTKLYREMEVSFEFFFTDYLRVNGNDARMTLVKKDLHDICKELGQLPKVLVHRDFHSKNIMVTKNQELAIIDFQDMMWGLPQYDLASLLEDCYWHVPKELKNMALKEYWENSSFALGAFKNFDVFNEVYLKVAIQRIIKAMGSFAMINRKKGDARYLKHISLSFLHLQNVLAEKERFSPLKNALEGIYYES